MRLLPCSSPVTSKVPANYQIIDRLLTFSLSTICFEGHATIIPVSSRPQGHHPSFISVITPPPFYTIFARLGQYLPMLPRFQGAKITDVIGSLLYLRNYVVCSTSLTTPDPSHYSTHDTHSLTISELEPATFQEFFLLLEHEDWTSNPGQRHPLPPGGCTPNRMSTFDICPGFSASVWWT